MNRFYGKYRGKVENNIDPTSQGRVQVSVPAVLGEGSLSWAMPCVPIAGSGVGLLTTPPVGANVWVEFEGGNTDFPILAGCFWGMGEMVALNAPLPQVKVLKLDGITLTLSELPGAGGAKLEVGPPAATVPMKLVMDSTGIELSMGSNSVKLSMTGVSINNGALEVI
jgi:hypothetical protein